MTATVAPELLQLGQVLGLVDSGGDIDTGWFADPASHLSTILSNDTQRGAALELVSSLLGTANGELDLPDIGGTSWVPIVRHPSGGALYLVIEEVGDRLDVLLGGRLTSQDPALEAGFTFLVPLVGIDLADGRAEILDRPAELAAALTFPGGLGTDVIDLEGVAIGAILPLTDLEQASLTITLQGLRLPGQAQAGDVSLYELADELGATGIRIGIGLLQAQFDSLPAELGHLLALAGLDPASPVPPLPVEDLLVQGPSAFRTWLADIFDGAESTEAWLGSLRDLLGLPPNPVGGLGLSGDPFELCFEDTGWRGCLTLVATPDPASGILTLVPGIHVTIESDGALSGGLDARLDLCRLTLGPTPTVEALPVVAFSARLEGGAGPLVDETITPPGIEVEIGSLVAGMGLRAGVLVPVFEARDVTLGSSPGDHYEVLDLTSSEALLEAAAGALDGIVQMILDALGVTTSDEGRALAALAGLIEPQGAGASWPDLVSLPDLFADPLGAIGCYHARVLDAEAGATDPVPWSLLAAEIGALLRAAGGPAPAVTGAGTAGDPWSLTLFSLEASTSPFAGEVEARIWADPNGDGSRLHFALGASPLVPDFAGKTLSLSYATELLRAELPAATSCPGPVDVSLVGSHSLSARLGTDLVFHTDGLALSVESIALELGWESDRLGLSYEIANPEIIIEGAPIALPPMRLDLDGDLPDIDLATLPWDAVQALAGAWFTDSTDDLLPNLGAILGWLPSLGDLTLRLPSVGDLELRIPAGDWPPLPLDQLAGPDPSGALRTWFGSLVATAAGDFPDLSLPLIARLGRLLAPAPDGLELPDSPDTLTAPEGTGTYEDPWRLPLAAGGPDLLAWVDPSGPSLAGLAGLGEHLVPQELIDAAGGTVALTQERLAELLGQVAALHPGLREALEGLDAGTVLGSLQSRLIEGDGLIPAAAQVPADWPTVALEPIAHLAEPAAFDAATHLPTGAPGAVRRVFVATAIPGLADWPGQTDARTIDLTAPGLAPEAFDLGAISGPGPWFVLLPGRRDAAVTQPEESPTGPALEGDDGLARRLRRVVQSAAEAAGGSLCVIAHSTAGQVARVVAAEGDVSHLVTLGTPHAAADLSFVTDLGAGEGIRLLQRLVETVGEGDLPGEAQPLLDALEALRSMTDGEVALGGGLLNLFPAEDAASPPAFPDVGSVQVLAVVGRLLPASVDRALAALCRAVIETAMAELPGAGAAEPITHLGLGVGLPLVSGIDSATQLRVEGDARLDLAHIRLQPGGTARPVPRLQVRAALRRNTGWLVGGPGVGGDSPLPLDPRVRWAEALIEADLSSLDLRSRVVLHDAAVFGVARSQWVLDDTAMVAGEEGSATLVPEARVLLGEIVARLKPLPSTGPLSGVVEVGRALRLIEVEDDGSVTVPPDPLERLLVDPLGELRARLAPASTDRAELIDALRTLLGAGGTDDELILTPAEGLEVVISLGTEGLGDAVSARPTELTIRSDSANGFTVRDRLRVDGAITARGSGEIQLDLRVGTSSARGPLGRPVVGIAFGVGAGAGPQVTLSFEDATVPAMPGTVSLFPLDVAPVADWAMRTLPALVLGHVLRWLGGLSDPVRRIVEMLGGQDEATTAGAPPPEDTSIPPGSALESAGPELRRTATSLFLGLTRDPAAWLLHPAILGDEPVEAAVPAPNGAPPQLLATLSAARLEQLLEVLRQGLGLTPTPGAPLSLPWGLLLDIEEAGPGLVALRLEWTPGTIAAGPEAGGSLSLEIHPGLEVRPEMTAHLRLNPGAGFDRAELTLGLDAGGTVSLAFTLEPSGGSAITIGLLPSVSGLDALGGLAGAAAQQVLPLLLDAAAADATIGSAVGRIGDALGLRTGGRFDGAALVALADADASDLAIRLAGGAASALTPLLEGLEDLLGQVASAVTVNLSTRTVTLTAFDDGTSVITVTLFADLTEPRLCVTATGIEPVAGKLRADLEVCVSADGLQRLRFWSEVIDDTWLQVPPVAFLPAAGILLGDAAGAQGNRVETGLWLAEPPTLGVERTGVFVSISTASGEVTGLCRSESGTSPGIFTDHDDAEAIAACVRAAMLAWLAPLLGELVIDVPEVTDLLRHQIGGRNIGNLLDEALVLREQGSGGSATYDLRPELFDSDVLGASLVRLASVLAGLGEIPGLDPLSIELRAEEDGTSTSYGVGVSLSEPLVLFDGDGFRLSLTNDVAWMDGGAPDLGITIFLLRVDDDDFAAAEFVPDVSIGGVGLAVDNPDDVLLDVLATIAGVEINVVYRRDFAPPSGGPSLLSARLLIEDLSIPIGRAGGGGNPVASKMLSQGTEEPETQSGDEEELAPSLSPQLRFDFEPTFGFSFELADGTLPIWVPVQRSFGPIYVEQVGADSSNGEDPRLILLLDGGVSLEGFALGVDDLSLSIPIKRPLDLDDWQLGLAGLALGYDRNGIRIAGGFRHVEGQYAGMVQIEAAQFGLTAVGAYGEFPVNAGSSTPTYTSFFIFGALSAPIGGPPAFFVTGIGAGVGLNRSLAIPDQIDRVPDFTLVKAMDPSSGFASNPLGSLEGLIDDFPVERGTFWLAAGIRFTSFALVESLAVLTVEIGDHLEINLLGLSSADLPSKQLTLARVELALRARFSTSEMLLSVEAQLTENSWILTSDCRLTGGFAFVVWFETGEFVLSLGGYHPRFKKPSTFPAVPRLGFNWSVSGALVIKGESYFALTSSCIMAGGKLEAGYTTSTVWATLTFGADAIFSWDPFFYEVSAYARVSAGIRIRICFFACATVRLSFSIGADVLVKGPDLSGKATLDLDVISVTVRFGSSEPPKPPALSWSKFHEKYLLQGDPADVALGLSFLAGLQPPDPSTTKSDTPPDDGTSSRPWRVLPEFVFVTNSRAASMLTVLAGNGASKEDDLSGAALGLAPMKLSNVTSVHRITLFADDGDVDISKLDFAKITGKVPEAIWLYASDANEPTEPRMRDAIVGATVIALPEIVGRGQNTIQIDQTQVGDRHPLPFHDEIAARADFVAISDSAIAYRLTQPQTTDAVLSAATIKALGTSNFERRVLTSELPTPPRLAALGEGMVDEVLAPAEVTPVVVEPETPEVRRPGRPNLVGVLRGGPSFAIEETVHTTVSAEVRKQVTAGRIPASNMPSLAAPDSSPPGDAPIRLELAGTRLVRAGRTMSTAGEPPATRMAGSQKWAVHGTGGSRDTLKTLRTLETRLERGIPLIAGDLTVWQVPGSQYDREVDGRAEQQRPGWMVAGTQQVRTVVLDRAGQVVADRTGSQYELELPVGSNRIVTLGVGVHPAEKAAEKTTPAGIDGWQETTTLAQVASGVHLGPRCVVTVDGGRERARRSARTRSSVDLASAGAAIAGADLVSTRLPSSTTAVAVLLDGVDELRCGDALERDLIVRIDGASPDGRRPRVLATENRLTVIYGVRPRRGASAVTVHVSRPEHWRLTGVVGADVEREGLVTQLEQRDVSTLLGPLVATSKGIAQAAWRAPGRPNPDLTISKEAGALVT